MNLDEPADALAALTRARELGGNVQDVVLEALRRDIAEREAAP